jgi:hypothetical protein
VALEQYAGAVAESEGGEKPSSASIKGLTFPRLALVSNGDQLLAPVETVVTALRGDSL